MINLRQRTGFSFRQAYGKLPDVMACVSGDVAAITDRASTFAHIRWNDLCVKSNKRPIFGVELAVVENRDEKKTPVCYVTFLAHNNIEAIYELYRKATFSDKIEPRLTYGDLNDIDCEIILGDHPRFDLMQPSDNISFMVHNGTPVAVIDEAIYKDFRLVAGSDNRYPQYADRGVFEVLIGRSGGSQTFGQHILSEDEWRSVHGHNVWSHEAIANTYEIAARSTATLIKAEMFKPVREKPLAFMCLEGAKLKGIDTNDITYATRLAYELKLINQKKFEDYFYIIADLMREAHSLMFCGPARGSSAGSLVCYLLGITNVDPIKHDLIFERFIDINRSDLPDIDIDLSDKRREKIFNYLEIKYGAERVARLGTAMMYKSSSTLNELCGALRIPKWDIANFKDSVEDRLEGHPRVYDCINDAFESPYGIEALKRYPELAVAPRLEGHPRHASRHAAGVVITADHVTKHVAIDDFSRSTQCEKRDAETIGLLKIDLLGLTQLSVFEHCLRLIGKPKSFIQDHTLDDHEAYEFFNSGHLTGIFQFNGTALRELTKQITVTCFEDIVALTSLARPGPMESGIAAQWIRRKIGASNIDYIHPSLEPILNKTLGCVIYQEQVMQICRDIGGMDWPDVSAVRKAMGKSLGPEYLNKWRDKFVPGAVSKGWSHDVADQFWNQLCEYGAYGFNRSHAVAYSMISYWCAVLKLRYPLEFSAATLSTIDEKEKIIELLKDLEREGFKYKSIDLENSIDEWSVHEGVLLGPLSGIKGIGPVKVKEIIDARERGEKPSKTIETLIESATTEYDTLWPIKTAFQSVFDDKMIDGNRISSKIWPIIELTDNMSADVVVIAELVKINHRDKNDEFNLKKRNNAPWKGDSKYLSLRVTDDTDTIFVNIAVWKYKELSAEIIERGVDKRPVYLFKGTIGRGFRMIHLDRFKFIGYLDPENKLKKPPPRDTETNPGRPPETRHTVINEA